LDLALRLQIKIFLLYWLRSFTKFTTEAYKSIFKNILFKVKIYLGFKVGFTPIVSGDTFIPFNPLLIWGLK
jgi:hypothetical protein